MKKASPVFGKGARASPHPRCVYGRDILTLKVTFPSVSRKFCFATVKLVTQVLFCQDSSSSDSSTKVMKHSFSERTVGQTGFLKKHFFKKLTDDLASPKATLFLFLLMNSDNTIKTHFLLNMSLHRLFLKHHLSQYVTQADDQTVHLLSKQFAQRQDVGITYVDNSPCFPYIAKPSCKYWQCLGFFESQLDAIIGLFQDYTVGHYTLL